MHFVLFFPWIVSDYKDVFIILVCRSSSPWCPRQSGDKKTSLWILHPWVVVWSGCCSSESNCFFTTLWFIV
jgi:hypothetical protein